MLESKGFRISTFKKYPAMLFSPNFYEVAVLSLATQLCSIMSGLCFIKEKDIHDNNMSCYELMNIPIKIYGKIFRTKGIRHCILFLSECYRELCVKP